MKVGDVVQFNENHEWCGCLGIIEEIKEVHNSLLNGDGKNDIRFMIGVPMPQGTAYMYALASEFSIELIGKAILTSRGGLRK